MHRLKCSAQARSLTSSAAAGQGAREPSAATVHGPTSSESHILMCYPPNLLYITRTSSLMWNLSVAHGLGLNNELSVVLAGRNLLKS